MVLLLKPYICTIGYAMDITALALLSAVSSPCRRNQRPRGNRAGTKKEEMARLRDRRIPRDKNHKMQRTEGVIREYIGSLLCLAILGRRATAIGRPLCQLVLSFVRSFVSVPCRTGPTATAPAGCIVKRFADPDHHPIHHQYHGPFYPLRKGRSRSHDQV